MAKRARRMTAHQVLDMLSDSEGPSDVEDMELSDDEEMYEVDDPYEPIMEGSDDEFSDLGEVEDDESDDDDMSTTPTSDPADTASSSATTSTSSSAPSDSGSTLSSALASTSSPPSDTGSSSASGSTSSSPSGSGSSAATVGTSSSQSHSGSSAATGTSSPPSNSASASASSSAKGGKTKVPWSSTLKSVTVNAFSSPVGPTVTIPESPLEIFQLFFTSDLLAEVVDESSRYARQVMGDEKFQTWTSITEVELNAYLGFCLLMSINHLPALGDYWARDPIFHYAPISEPHTLPALR